MVEAAKSMAAAAAAEVAAALQRWQQEGLQAGVCIQTQDNREEDCVLLRGHSMGALPSLGESAAAHLAAAVTAAAERD